MIFIFRNTTPPRPAGTRQEPRRNRVNKIKITSALVFFKICILSRILDLAMVLIFKCHLVSVHSHLASFKQHFQQIIMIINMLHVGIRIKIFENKKTSLLFSTTWYTGTLST